MPRRKQFDPDRALNQAMELFWERGYEGTSVQDLLDRLGINRFSLYAAFGSKRSLFLRALDRYRDSVATEWLGRLEAPDAGLEEVRAYFHASVRRLSGPNGWRACLMLNSAVERVPHDQRAAEKVRAHLERLERAFRAALEQAQGRSQMRAGHDPVRLARYLTGSVQGLGVLAKIYGDPKVLEDYTAQVLAVLE